MLLIVLLLTIGSTCFGHYYAHPQELTTIVLITTWAVLAPCEGRTDNQVFKSIPKFR